MKRLPVLFLCVAFCVGVAAAQQLPRFSDYPARPEKTRAKAIDFRNSPGARTFRTRLREAIKGDVNFAGRYILTGWGCGTGCSQMAVIDARTGRVYFPDPLAGVSAWFMGVDDDYEVYTFRRDSRLLVLRGTPGPMTDGDSNEKEGTYYYEWRTNRLRLVKFVPRTPPNAAN